MGAVIDVRSPDRVRTARAAAVAVGIAIGALAVGGCEWFRPDDPEPPAGSSIVPNYSDPDSLLATIALAIADKGITNGQTAYLGAFADTANDPRGFHAFFDPQTVNRMEQAGVVVPDDWDRDDEASFYPRLVTLNEVPATAEYLMQWFPDPSQGNDEIGTETARLYREYRIYAASGGDFLNVAWGRAILDLVQLSSTRWVIVAWHDREAIEADLQSGEVSMGQRRLEPGT